MSKLLVLIIFSISLSSFAEQNNVGERVIYRLIIEGRDQGIVISDITGKISDTIFIRKTQLYIEDSEEIFESEISNSALVTPDENSHIIKNCKKIGGKEKNIYVAGRISKVCQLSIHNDIAKKRLELIDFSEKELSSGFAWIGQAPFYGIVKLNTPELIMDLTYYRWSKD
jgi:hypothetical protein